MSQTDEGHEKKKSKEILIEDSTHQPNTDQLWGI